MPHPTRLPNPLFLTCVLANAIASPPTYATENEPNVLVIVADDLGYGDVKCFGQGLCRIETPHLDRLATQGVRYTQAYATASVCVPSRISMMTGRYAFRFPPPQPGGPWGFLGLQIPQTHPTIAKMLSDRGYETGYVGKWHLGTSMTTFDNQRQDIGTVDYNSPIKVGPRQYSFANSFILPGSLDMYPYAFIRDHQWVGDVTAVKGWSAFARMGPASHDFKDDEVLDRIATEASRFIEEERDQPFFLFVGLTAPHTPTSPAQEFLGKSGLGVYGDFVMNTDHTVGRILDTLERTKQADNTLVIVTSDHGPASYAGAGRRAIPLQMKQLEAKGHYAAGGLRGYKFSAYEGAFRVPLILRWPERVAAGVTSDQIVGLVDLLATIDDATFTKGTDLQTSQSKSLAVGPDSISLLPPTSEKNPTKPRESILLQGSRGFAYRKGDWKLILCPGSGAAGIWGNQPASDDAWKAALQEYHQAPNSHTQLERYPFVQLYNLSVDPAESNNLAKEQADRVSKMINDVKTLILQGHSQADSRGSVPSKQVSIFRYLPAPLKKLPAN